APGGRRVFVAPPSGDEPAGPRLACYQGYGLGGTGDACMQGAGGLTVGEGELLLAQVPDHILGADWMGDVDSAAGSPPLLAPFAGPLAARLDPVHATWLLAGAAVALAGCSTVALALMAAVLLGAAVLAVSGFAIRRYWALGAAPARPRADRGRGGRGRPRVRPARLDRVDRGDSRDARRARRARPRR